MTDETRNHTAKEMLSDSFRMAPGEGHMIGSSEDDGEVAVVFESKAQPGVIFALWPFARPDKFMMVRGYGDEVIYEIAAMRTHREVLDSLNRVHALDLRVRTAGIPLGIELGICDQAGAVVPPPGNCLALYRCPACGQRKVLLMTVEGVDAQGNAGKRVLPVEDDGFESPFEGDTDFVKGGTCVCPSCGHSGVLEDFEVFECDKDA